MLSNLNAITVLLIVIFILPIFIGIFMPFSREKVQYSLGSLMDSIEFLGGVVLSIYLTKKIFFENDGSVFKKIYEFVPMGIRNLLYGRDVLTYMVVVPFILLFMLLVLRLFTVPLYRKILVPFSDVIYRSACGMGNGFKRILAALWQVPKAIYIVLICAIVLNFYSYYFYSPLLAKWMNESVAYQFLYEKAVYPVLNSNIAKQIPVLLNDSFRSTLGGVMPKRTTTTDEQTMNRQSVGIVVIEYFNGVTLDEAIKSTPEIDNTAKELTAGKNSSIKKAHAIYKWISSNIDYDYVKSEKIVSNSQGVVSGSIEAFATKKGICFDYSCLYISMCRAAGLKVRMITGLGYSGVSWGDHAWNQVYSFEIEKWVNLDTTFGSLGANYFDKPDFYVDHQDGEIQREW